MTVRKRRESRRGCRMQQRASTASAAIMLNELLKDTGTGSRGVRMGEIEQLGGHIHEEEGGCVTQGERGWRGHQGP